ncbi:MAG: tetratricopeptide repeat protein [Bdellovibrionota bacterium]
MTEENLAKKFGLATNEQINSKLPILVVDDQQDLRLIVAHHLTKLQFNNVIQASNGMEALDILRSAKEIAAVICDMEMPNMNGLELIQEIREDLHAKRIPFCLAMDNVSKEKIMLGVEHGVDEILVKPFTLGDIIPKLRSAYKIFHNPTNPEPVYELAKQKIRDKQYDEAIAIYKVLLQSTKKSARPHVGLAKIEKEKGNFTAALEYLQQAEEKNENYVHLYSVRGDIYVAQQKLEQAIEQYKKGIQLSPLNPIRYLKAVEVLIEQEKYEESVQLLQMAIDKNLSFPELYHFMSQASYQLKDYKNAIKYVRHALQADEKNLKYLNQLAISYKESNQPDEAQKTYNSMIKIDPDNLTALFNKSILMHERGNLDEAIKIMDRVTKKHPDFAKAQEKLKQFEKEQNNKGAA